MAPINSRQGPGQTTAAWLWPRWTAWFSVGGSGRYLIEWSHEGKYTPFGQVLDAGITCLRAIDNYDCDQNPETCGITGEKTSGNGILMRIMPVVLYAIAMEEQGKTDTAGAIGMIHQVGVSDP